ncbi:SDR family oxidoreductase [Halorussus sp. AFM4]|uniref:SDR family oxidoreductase n=1 Tax=Halorussus sp. AFM4 TaxID=3421651 RepID=UPI003EB789A3
MPEEDMLADEVAIVTGGASGNGREIALTFAEEGADVVIADLDETPREGGTPTHERIREETDSDAEYVECDVSSISDLAEMVDAAEKFGGVTILVNNAGITESRSFLETTEEQYDTMLDVNLKGAFFGAQAAAKSMVESDRDGSIINISSTSGIYGRPDGVAYCASKGGVKLMTYALAASLAPDIRVNAIHPDVTETEMTKTDLDIIESPSGKEYVEQDILLQRTGKPEDVADAALYLASDMASFVTGHSLVVDGGVTATK